MKDAKMIQVRRSIALLAIALLTMITACSTIADQGGQAEFYPHGGTGLFRLLDRSEVGIRGSLPGRSLGLQDTAFASGMVADGELFYAAAEALEEEPVVPEDWPVNEIYWPAFGPVGLYRSPARDNFGFSPGNLILTAELDWEGSSLRDPWVLIEPDGSALLYYAAEGGIGVARAPSASGPYTRPSDEPLIRIAGSISEIHRPSVIRGPDGQHWMYFEVSGHLEVARSADGLTFELLGPLTFAGEDLGPGIEVAQRAPGALSVETPAGRNVTRLYFESERDDGTRGIYVAGSEDGQHFERHPRQVLDTLDARAPAPVSLDPRTTLLYATAPFFSGSLQTRAFIGSVSPSSTVLVPEEP